MGYLCCALGVSRLSLPDSQHHLASRTYQVSPYVCAYVGGTLGYVEEGPAPVRVVIILQGKLLDVKNWFKGAILNLWVATPSHGTLHSQLAELQL